METSMLLEYGWVLLAVLVGLEGILAADNAVVMAVMVKHLPADEQKKALFYGLLGAFVFRFATLFMISFLELMFGKCKRLEHYIYSLFLFIICMGNLVVKKKERDIKEKKQSSFWVTVLKVELADIPRLRLIPCLLQ